MQQHPVFVLFDPSSDLEQREHDGPGLSRPQGHALQAYMAKLPVQDVGTGGEQLAGDVGETRRTAFVEY